MNTTYFQNLVMGNLFGTRQTPGIPAGYYIGLSATEPNPDGTGVTEPDTPGDGYQRIKLDTLSAPVDGEITNTVAVLFPECEANWGVMTHFVIYDAATGGNLLLYNKIEPRTAEVNTVIMIKPGSLSLVLMPE